MAFKNHRKWVWPWHWKVKLTRVEVFEWVIIGILTVIALSGAVSCVAGNLTSP